MKLIIKRFIAVPLLIISSLALVFLLMEGAARLYDMLGPQVKIVKTDYNWDSRLKGYGFAKKEGISRVLVLGDSISFGQGVTAASAYPAILENRLNGTSGKKSFEVINTGVCGIGPFQELSILMDKGPYPALFPDAAETEGLKGMAYSPDLIVMQYTVENDAYDDEELLKDEKKAPHGHIRFSGTDVRRVNYGPYALPIPYGIDKALTLNSRFYSFFLHKYHILLTRLGLRDELSKIRAMYEPSAKGWIAARSAMSRIAIAAREKGIPVVFMLWSKTGETGLDDIYRLVAEEAEKKGFHVLDLSKALMWPDKDLSVSLTDGHPNEEAHRIGAEALYKFIMEKGLLLKKGQGG